MAGDDIAGYVAEAEMQVVRRKVTMVFQNGALFDSITVGENVAFLRERGDMEEEQTYTGGQRLRLRWWAWREWNCCHQIFRPA